MDPRKQTWYLAQRDLEAALKYAKDVNEVWYRVQSLSTVAWFTKPRSNFLKIVVSALDEARRMTEPNRIVSCAAWVVRTMTERADVDSFAVTVVNELIEVVEREENPVRRADALLLLFEAVFPKQDLRKEVLDRLLAACAAMNSWKQPRILSDVALILAKTDPQAAAKVVQMIDNKSERRRAGKALERAELLGPHEFFPYYAKPVN